MKDDIQWDKDKAAANLLKHGVEFLDAAGVLHDDRAIVFEDARHEDQRHVAIGMDHLGRVLVVAYTWRGDAARIISARKATKHEAGIYERGY